MLLHTTGAGILRTGQGNRVTAWTRCARRRAECRFDGGTFHAREVYIQGRKIFVQMLWCAFPESRPTESRCAVALRKSE
jgi:hypothetical protein